MSARVLHVVTNFAGPGGAEKMLGKLIDATPGQPTDLVSLMTIPPLGRALVTRDDVPMTALGARGPIGLVRAARALADIIRERRPVAVMAWMYHANVVASLARRWSGHGTRLLWNIRHSLDDIASEKASTRAAIRMGRALSGSPDAIVYAARRAMEQHEAYGFVRGKGIALPNGYALPSAPRPLPEVPRIFGTVARWHVAKDYPTMLAAFARIAAKDETARFRLAGLDMNPGNAELGAALDASGLPRDRCELIGSVSDIGAFYRSLDVFCLSSISEGFPNVLAEAMSHGVPCASTDAGDASLIVGKTGEIVPVRDAGALAAALHRVAAPEDYPVRAAAARRRIEENFSMEAVARRYMDVLRPAR